MKKKMAQKSPRRAAAAQIYKKLIGYSLQWNENTKYQYDINTSINATNLENGKICNYGHENVMILDI